ncbi:MAG: LysR family transcriptional regulator, partial [Nannocystaceae bacterium]
MDDPPETSELMTLAAVAEATSISKAARALGVPRPTVSRRLARLEDKLGVRLLRRTTRAMALTDAGEVLYARARTVLAAVRDAVESVQERDDVVRGVVRVSVPPMTGAATGALISGFLAKYPQVRLELEASSRHVDLLADGYDVAIRGSSDLPPGLIARSLARSRVVAVASAEYLERAGTPSGPAELSEHSCLAGFTRGEHPTTQWPLMRGGTVRIEPLLATNDLATLRVTALAGRGIALLPQLLVHAEL